MKQRNQKPKTYSDKLRDPRWQKRRLEIMQRDKFACQKCGDDQTTLNVHHRWYETGKEPWEYDDAALVTICENCHKVEYETRREREAQLLAVLRKKFFADDLRVLVDAFHYMQFDEICEPEIFAAALDHFLIETVNVQRMVDSYCAWKQEREEAERECFDDGESDAT